MPAIEKRKASDDRGAAAKSLRSDALSDALQVALSFFPDFKCC